MTDYDPNPSPLTRLPLRKFEHVRVSTQDAPPVPWSGTSSSTSCAVCHDHVGRYTCPRCETPYCSIPCYQAHSTGDASSCTEGFYQERVQSIVQLEQKAKQQDTLDLLNRTYNNHNSSGPEETFLCPLEEEDSEVDTRELLELLTLLEKEEEEEEGKNEEQLQQLSSFLAKSPKLKASFEAAIEKGDLLKMVLKAWDPWWRPILSSSSPSSEPPPPIENSTLDERLLRVKPFDSLFPKGAKRPNLSYNLLDVLYSIAHTLRLYHGVPNIISCNETALEAAQTLLQGSFVLNQDARYESVEEALMKRVNSSPHWKILAEDVALLVAHRRLIGRALLEAIDIVQASLKSVAATATGSSSCPKDTLRRQRKKLEFFLSWSQYYYNDMNSESLPEKVRDWRTHWTLTTSKDKTTTEDNRLQVVQGLLDDERAHNRMATNSLKQRGLIEELD
jgi:HIT zinc finger